MGLRYNDHSVNLLYDYILKYSSVSGFGSINFLLVIFSLIIIIACVFVGKKLLERKPNFKHYDPNEYPQKLKGYGGLLFLAKALLLFMVIISFINFYNSLYLYGTNAWVFLTANNEKYPSPWWPLTIIFIVSTNLFLLLYSVFIVIVAVKKKRIFKFTVIMYLYSTLFIGGIKYFLFSQMLDASHEIVYQSFIYMSFLLQISIIISAYMAFSRRVNATFSK